MSNEIIDFYKKAVDEKNEEVVFEKDETLESLSATNDPFKNFLLELTDKLKGTKIEEDEKLNVINEVIDDEKKELEVKESSEEKDAFSSFLNDFSDIVSKQIKEKEEEVKNTAINFIEKLKIEKPKNPKKKNKQPTKILNKIKIVEELEKKSESPKPVTNDKSTYVDQLETIDKTDNISQKVKEKSDLKSLVAKQVKEELEKFKVQFSKLAIEGGGGSVAVQYAKGGTMDGDLNVTGKFLSGGKDLSSIFTSTSGSGLSETDRLISGSSSLILNPDGSLVFPDDNTIRPPDDENLTLQSENPELSAYTKIVLSPYAFFAYDSQGNSVTFDKIENSIILTSQDEYEWTFNNQGVLVGPANVLTVTSLSSLGQILSGGKDLTEIFSKIGIDTLVTENSARWNTSYNIATAYQNISSSFATNEFVNSNFLNLSGGIITNNLTIQGNISALGTATFANTIFTTTSALSVVNTGPGPALYVFQAAGPYDVASFYDGDGIEVLHVGNAGSGGFGKVGINESFPNEELTVRGSISATETIYDNEGNSIQWNKAYDIGTAYQSVSSTFLTQETDSQTLTFTQSSANLSISNGNVVSLSSLNNEEFAIAMSIALS